MLHVRRGKKKKSLALAPFTARNIRKKRRGPAPLEKKKCCPLGKRKKKGGF